LAGVLWLQTRPELHGWNHVAAPLLLASLAGVAARLLHRRVGVWAPVLALAAVVAFAAAGVGWAGWRAQLDMAARGQAPAQWPVDRLVTGTVVSIPEHQTGRLRFDFAPAAARSQGLPRRIRLSWYDVPVEVRAAERWQLQVRLRPPRGFANPGGFDYEGQLFREGVGAVGYVRAAPDNRRLAAAGVRRPVLQLRAVMVARIGQVVGDSPFRGVIAGLAVGATQDIAPEQWRVFQATGITHLIAISGLHVTLIAVLGMALVSLLWRLPWRPAPGRCRRDVAVAVGAVAATGYALLAGFSVPTQRTLIMFLAALAALRLRRAQPPAHVLSLALMAVLLFDPHAALSAGFWLSFLCVAAILWTVSSRGRASGGVSDSVPGRLFGAARGAAAAFLHVQGAVTVILLPATLLLFGGVSAVAPLVNLLAIPYFSFLLVPAIVLALLLTGVAPQAGAGLLKLAAFSLEQTWPLLERAAALPGAFSWFQSPGPLLMTTLAASAVVIVTPLPWRLRALAALALLPLLFMPPQRPPPGGVWVTVLDVGQGLAVLVRTHGHALLYDTGPAFRGGRSTAGLAIVPFLRHAGVRRLDVLVVSHPDNDHAGGARTIVDAVKVDALRFGGNLPVIGGAAPAAHACRRGQSWTWDAVRFEFVHPAPGAYWNRNDGSCVLRVVTAGGSVLLTGDVLARAERTLVAGGLAPADVVVVPHHGSRSSSTAEFVRAVQARQVIVSAGHLNRWGFPHPEVVRRWCEAGAWLSDTAGWGAVSVVIDPRRGMQAPRAYRLERRRYWHAAPAAAGRSPCLL
jgi:competence protein ComEC